MSFKANIQNLLYFIGRLAPMIMVFFFVFASIINMDWRGFIYLSGVVFASFFTILLSRSFESFFDTTIAAHPVCTLTEEAFSKLPLSGVILSFTITYLFLPMTKTYGKITNPLLFICFLLFVAVDVMFLINNNCSKFNLLVGPFLNNLLPIIIAYGIGAAIATIYVVVLSSTNNGNLLYFGKAGEDALCKKKDKKFTCKVYKNGELLTA